MADVDRDNFGRSVGGAVSSAEAAAIDAGLRGYMLRIYNYMGFGLAITGVAALGIYALSVTGDAGAAAKMVHGGAEVPAQIAENLYLTPLGYAVFVTPLKWLLILAPLGLVIGLSFAIDRINPPLAQLVFWVYATLIGGSLGSVFILYSHTSVVRVFFITAAAFGALSLWGYTTRRDLTAFGSFLTMGLFGLVIAAIANAFMASSALQWAISIAGVLVFSGLTAWDTRRLKDDYIYGAMDGDTAERTAILGALSLYLDFVNLFALLLQVAGEREE